VRRAEVISSLPNPFVKCQELCNIFPMNEQQKNEEKKMAVEGYEPSLADARSIGGKPQVALLSSSATE